MERENEVLEFSFKDLKQDTFYAIRESTLIVYGGYYQSIFKRDHEAENFLKRTEIEYHKKLIFYGDEDLKFFHQSERRNSFCLLYTSPSPRDS